ncbi:hypothetical protein HDV05_005141 [Chytridiales sp. JEL 0842]|nr:hypothetical protein HDV05_005141 [Chytridiales sp. JEL 0842]
MSSSDASRIQSSQATAGHGTGAGSFASRAQSAGARNEASSGGGRGKASSGGGGGRSSGGKSSGGSGGKGGHH